MVTKREDFKNRNFLKIKINLKIKENKYASDSRDLIKIYGIIESQKKFRDYKIFILIPEESAFSTGAIFQLKNKLIGKTMAKNRKD